MWEQEGANLRDWERKLIKRVEGVEGLEWVWERKIGLKKLKKKIILRNCKFDRFRIRFGDWGRGLLIKNEYVYAYTCTYTHIFGALRIRIEKKNNDW